MLGVVVARIMSGGPVIINTGGGGHQRQHRWRVQIINTGVVVIVTDTGGGWLTCGGPLGGQHVVVLPWQCNWLHLW